MTLLADAVIVAGPTGFVATQQAIGALEFIPLLSQMKPGSAMGDFAGCVRGGFTSATLGALTLRQIRYACSHRCRILYRKFNFIITSVLPYIPENGSC